MNENMIWTDSQNYHHTIAFSKGQGPLSEAVGKVSLEYWTLKRVLLLD